MTYLAHQVIFRRIRFDWIVDEMRTASSLIFKSEIRLIIQTGDVDAPVACQSGMRSAFAGSDTCVMSARRFNAHSHSDEAIHDIADDMVMFAPFCCLNTQDTNFSDIIIARKHIISNQ